MLKFNKKHSKVGIKKLVIVALILITYGVFAINEFGLQQGLLITLLTWSFFVFCTPIADAGILVDLPIRIVTGIKMLYSEITVWAIAALVNIFAYIFHPVAYEHTQLLKLFHKIITNPWPFWLIIILSAVGTFTSVILDDDLYNIATSKNRKRSLKKEKFKLYFTIGTFATTVAMYILVLHFTHTNIKIF